MQLLRPAAARGHVVTACGDSRHAFSSGSFHDPAWSGWSALRRASEDRFAAEVTADPRRHANIEVLRLVVDGALACRRAGGGVDVLTAGDWEWLGAGHGQDDDTIGAAGDAPARALHFWLQPDRLNAAPAQARHRPDAASRRHGWTLVASPDGRDGGLPIRLQARVRTTLLAVGDARDIVRDPARGYWLQVVAGRIEVDALVLDAGDALAIAGEEGALRLHCAGPADADVLWFDLPG